LTQGRLGLRGFQVWDRDEGVAIEEGGTCVRGRRLLGLFGLVWFFQ